MDLDRSGSKLSWRQREGIWEHYQAALRGEFQILLCFDVSRLGRDKLDTYDFVSAFKQAGIKVFSVSEGIEVTDDLPADILILVAHHYSKQLGIKVKAAAARRAKDGRIHGGGLPSWVRWNADKRPVVNEEQRNAIRRIVSLRTVEALSERKIAKRLNEEGFRTVRNARWTEAMVNKYLRDDWIETMQGTGFFGRSKDEDERIRILQAFPAIITTEEADALRAVQRVHRAKYAGIGNKNWAVNRKGKPRLSLSSPYLLGGLFKCSHCGKAMVGGKKQGGRRIYSCPQGTASADLHPPGLASIDRDQAEDAMLRVIRHALLKPPPPEIDLPVKTMEPDLLKLESRLSRLEDTYLDGDIARERYLDKKREIELQIGQVRQSQSKAAMPDALRQAQALNDDPSQEQLNQIAHLLVEKVEGPITFEGVMVRVGALGLRKFLRVTLRYPVTSGERVFLAPIYKSTWSGERVIHPRIESENCGGAGGPDSAEIEGIEKELIPVKQDQPPHPNRS